MFESLTFKIKLRLQKNAILLVKKRIHSNSNSDWNSLVLNVAS